MAEEKTSEPILQDAFERFEESQDGTDFNRNAFFDDIAFSRLGRQWDEKVKDTRVKEGRPCLTINKLPSFIRQVVNDARQNKPAINVHPVDNGADKNTALAIGGLVRSIERRSNAAIAYDTAIDNAVSGGFGFFRIGIDYCHDETFKMECRIHRVPNPLMVHWDPNSTAFDASDWAYAFVSDMLTEDQFEERYPKAAKVSFEGDDKDRAANWIDGEKIRIAEYWERIEKKRTILALKGQNGIATVRKDSIPGMAKKMFADMGIDPGKMSDDELIRAHLQMNGLEESKSREVCYYEVKRRIISGVEVLEGEDDNPWPGSTIPICPVWGEEVIHDGRRYFRSMIQDAKDPQLMFNFWRSATTELVALAPRAPWLMEEGAIPKGQEGKWQTANSRSHAYLSYTKGSQVPQRQAFAGVPAGALQEALNASDDMKAIMGIYDPSLGARSNETSGKAIIARQKESDVSNFHFVDNLNRAIAYAGKVLVEIIPHVYTAQDSVRILGEDMKEAVIQLSTENQGETAFVPGSAGVDGMDAQPPLYDFTVGKYDVTVEAGPSYSTAREETRETLVQIMAQVPGAAMILGDVLMEHMDFQGADKIAERLKLLLPPQIQAAEGIQAPPMPMMPPPGGMPPSGAPPAAPPPVSGAPHAPPAMPAPPQGVPGL